MIVSGSSLRLVACVVAAGLVGTPADARAQPADEAVDEATRLAADAKRAFVEGRFDEAIVLYERARAHSSDPVLFRNLGKCHEAAGGVPGAPVAGTIAHFDAAVASYQAYLDSGATPADRDDIERRVVALRELSRKLRLGETATANAPRTEPARPVRPPDEPESLSPVPIVVLATGAAGLTAAMVTGMLANGAASDAAEAPTGVEAFAAQGRADDLALATNVLLGVAGAVFVAGAVATTVDVVSAVGSRPAVRVALGPGWMGVVVQH